MDDDAQKLYLNSMISNPELFARVNNLLSPTYFDPQFAKGVKFLQEYFQENRAVPAPSIFTAATKLLTEKVELQRQDVQYVAEQIAEFCKFQACIEVIRKATGKDGYFETGDLGKMVAQMKEATQIGLQTDFGIDYFDNPLERLERAETEDAVISTGWKDVDAVIGGGIGRQELIMFLAPSGGGKSVAMLNLSLNLLAQGLKGVYISLEMRDKKVALRTDQMIAKIAAGNIADSMTQVAHEIEKFAAETNAKFFIKRMREGSNANDIIAYLRQLEAHSGFKPDFIVVDYLDIMTSVQKGIGDSMFLKDKYVSEEVRAIGFDYDCIMISASQLEKGATEKINNGDKMHQGNVQGGSSKTNTADLMIATVKTDQMHEAGEYRFEFPKSRNSDANTKQVMMGWDKTSLRIFDPGSQLTLNKKKRPGLELTSNKPGAKKNTLEDMLSKFEPEKHNA
jgi:replicative DNA helicase